VSKKFCFVVSPIGDPGSQTRRRADGVLREIIQPALEGAYDVERADHDKTPGIVTEAIIGSLIDAHLVVADLSGLNANVMYELAIRHATARPLIQMMEVGGVLPFDIRGQNTVFFEDDLAGRSAAIRDLRAAEEALSKNSDIGNPIRRAAQFRALQSSAKPDDRAIGELLQTIAQEVAAILSDLHRSPAALRGIGRLASHRPLRDHEMRLASELNHDEDLKRQGIEIVSTRPEGDGLRVAASYQGRVISVKVPGPFQDDVEGTVEYVVAALRVEASTPGAEEDSSAKG
jgi:hypothetical protein